MQTTKFNKKLNASSLKNNDSSHKSYLASLKQVQEKIGL